MLAWMMVESGVMCGRHARTRVFTFFGALLMCLAVKMGRDFGVNLSALMKQVNSMNDLRYVLVLVDTSLLFGYAAYGIVSFSMEGDWRGVFDAALIILLLVHCWRKYFMKN